jgi:hypothetical protein
MSQINPEQCRLIPAVHDAAVARPLTFQHSSRAARCRVETPVAIEVETTIRVGEIYLDKADAGDLRQLMFSVVAELTLAINRPYCPRPSC